MIEIHLMPAFRAWIKKLRDSEARTRIASRIDRLSRGNFGDVAPVGRGVSEMRIHYGTGYRVYFVRRGHALVILLCGGDKKTQAKDIENAKQLMTDWENNNG